MADIVLHEITAANWRATLALGVHPEQQRFVADCQPIAAIVLAKAYVGAGGMHWQPYAIATDGQFIGMLALAHESGNSTDYWLFHFFIDQRWQGQGYGRAALRAVVELVGANYPQCRQIRLTVNPENTPGQRLYASVGFRPSGEQLHGELIYVLDLPAAPATEIV